MHCLFESQAGGQIRATAAGLHHSHSNLGSKLCLRATPRQSLNLLSKAGIEPVFSWILVGFVTAEPRWELPFSGFLSAKWG